MISFLLKALSKLTILVLGCFAATVLFFYCSFLLETLGMAEDIRLALLAALSGVFVLLFLFMAFPLFNSYSLGNLPLGTLRFILSLAILGFTGFQLYDLQTPPSQSYSYKDLLERDDNLETTNELLHKLQIIPKEEIAAIAIEPTQDTMKFVELEQANVINSWKQLTAQRAIIEQLDSFDRFQYEEQQTHQYSWETIKTIGDIYTLQTLLQARLGNLDQAVKQLCLFQRVSRKAMAGSTDLIQKMGWSAIIETNLRTAYQLCYEFTLSPKILAELAHSFAPLTEEELSLFKPWLGEYLFMRKGLGLPGSKLLAQRYVDPTGLIPPPTILQIFPPQVTDILYKATVQKNRTMQKINEDWLPVLADYKKSLISKHLEQTINRELTPPLNNLGGWYLFRLPDYKKFETNQLHLKGKGILLANHLAKLRSPENSSVEAVTADGLVSEESEKGSSKQVSLLPHYRK